MNAVAAEQRHPAHPVVSEEDWVAARKALLAREKEFTRLRDELSAARRELPWVRVEKDYVFDGPNGSETLADLFVGRSQLIVQHFMFGPDWKEGCPSCSLLADHLDGALWHLPHRDVAVAVVSRAPYATIEPFRRRMGWTFKWVSSFGSDFNYDHHVSHRPEDVASGAVYYNYEKVPAPMEELPGLTVFAKNEAGEIFRTYTSFGRGADILIGAYNFLDLVPKGRDEDGLPFTMSWVRHHDRYEDAKPAAASCCDHG